MPRPRIDRALLEMIEQLETQLSLLDQYCVKAFEERRSEFLPEVATKLRILLVRSRKNVPLLFECAKRLEVEVTVRLDDPPIIAPPGEPGPGDEVSLDAFFDLEAVGVKTKAGFVTMTKRQLIRAWCEQLGGAHEDWAVDEALVNAIRAPIRVGGMQPMVMELRNCAHTALRYGRDLVRRGRLAAQPPSGA